MCKSFIQTLLSTIIIEAALVLYAVFTGFYEFDFANVFTWIVLVGIPVVNGVLGMIICSIQNAVTKQKGGRK